MRNLDVSTRATENGEASDLAARFEEFRVRAGLTKTALAKPRYSVSFVSQIEAGRRRPSPEALAFFAGRLQVSPEFLVTGIPDGLKDSLRFRLEDARQQARTGESQEAMRTVDSVIGNARRYDLPDLEGEALTVRGEALTLDSRTREAIDVLEEAIERPLPERAAGMAVRYLATAYRQVGDLTYAAEVIERYLRSHREVPLDPVVAAELQAVLISIYFERGDMERARQAAERALAAADTSAPLHVRANSYWNASRVMAENRKWSEALDLITRARVLMEELDERRNVARLHNAQAFIYLEADPPQTKEAAAHLQRAEDLLRDIGAREELAYVFTEMARVHLLEGRPSRAVEEADRALRHVGTGDLEAARSLFVKGRGLAAMGQSKEARQTLLRAASIFSESQARQQAATCWREIGALDLDGGDLPAALEALKAGLDALDPVRSRA